MKKIVLFALFNLLGSVAFAQIVLEEEFTSVGVTRIHNVHKNITNSVVQKYLVHDKNTGEIEIIGLDYSFIKSVNLPGNPEVKYIYLVSTNLFNNDDAIEFVAYYKSGDEFVLGVFDEDGNQILSLGDHFYATAYVSENGFKMLTYTSNFQHQKIYGLGGDASEVSLSDTDNNYATAYPNPASNHIDIAYSSVTNTTIKIFNQNGILIDQVPVSANLNKIRLNVSSYATGVYIYRYNDVSNTFVVQ